MSPRTHGAVQLLQYLAPLGDTSTPSPSSTQPTLSRLTLSWSAYIFSLALALLELVYPRLTTLDADDIIENARRNTRLHDLGAAEASFRANLQKFAAHCSHNSTALSRFVHRTSAIAFAENRLRVVAYTRAHPEAASLSLRPLVICGLPRTGTTLLQSCLALDEASCRVRGLRQWEVTTPAPLAPTAAADVRLRQRVARFAMRFGDAFVYPEQRVVTGIRWDSLAEDYPLLHLSLLLPLHIATATLCEEDAGGLYDWCTAGGDARAAYAMYAEALRVLVHSLPAPAAAESGAPPRVLLKCPEHTWALDALFDVFPDAQVVWTHREPAATIASYSTQAAALTRFLRGRVEPRRVGPAVQRCFADGVRRGIAARAGREGQVLDVGYEALRRDPAAEVRRVKAWAGLPHDGASEARLSAFLGGGARGAAPAPAGKHKYSAEFFGVDEADVASDFAEYRRRFGRFLT